MPIRRLKRLFGKSNPAMRKVHVYALVGETGTGKSFRARLLTEKYNIDLVIDDGLLIRGQRILAGKSAKREKNRVTAIKRAIFENPAHAADVLDALTAEKFRSILLIGTSEKMVGRIAERLELPYPDQIIYIRDVATEEEILRAQESRKRRGKHVIPVPVIEVKQEPGHRILDSVRLFMKQHPYLFWKKEIVEKAVVQPPFSRRGRLSISEMALGQMVMHCVEEFSPGVKIRKVTIDLAMDGYSVEVKLSFPYGTNVSETLSGLQEYILRHVESYTGIHIDALDITVDRVEKTKKPEKDA